jgi:hypothetical protein
MLTASSRRYICIMHPSVCETAGRDMAGLSSRRLELNSKITYVGSVVGTVALGQVPLPVFHFSPTTLIALLLSAHISFITDDPNLKAADSIHPVVCLTRCLYFLPKPVLHRVWSSAYSFNLHHPLSFLTVIQWLLTSSSSFSCLFLPLSFLQLRVLGRSTYERCDQSPVNLPSTYFR